MPILVYVLITAMIGGIQMFDVPQIITSGLGTPDNSLMTLIMFLNNHLTNNNVGMGGAVSVLIFIVTAILSVFVYRSLMRNYRTPKDKSTKTKISAARTLKKSVQNEEVQA
jgi:multiple sugar transport system permease protein